MNRWKSATAQFWRTEPAAPLALYCLLLAADPSSARRGHYGQQVSSPNRYYAS
ncbi:MAG TPA: hypothetical protein VMA72_17505 [Streptosporangiaceae bacterium]|nr:hypothetical protein [Streptosporangiaceae bacterium]